MIESLVAAASPFPLVELDSPTRVNAGLCYPCPDMCKSMRAECMTFYETLRTMPPRLPVQCPSGFAAVPFPLGERVYAATALILFPRLGGDAERKRAKQHSTSHVALSTVREWIAQTSRTLEALQALERHAVSSHLEALHEVRRLNQTAKVILERICNRTTSGQPEAADPDLVRAWKASLLISHHLDALDILANPSLRTAVPDREIIFYKLIDSVYRIYIPRATEKNVRLTLTGNSFKRAKVYSNTIHIAPSAFIDNAIKYSPSGSDVEVRVSEGARDNRPTICFSVTSTGPAATPAEEARLFRTKGRAAAARLYGEGSGVGLVTVQMVADQHRAHVSAEQRKISPDRSEWTFRFEIFTTD